MSSSTFSSLLRRLWVVSLPLALTALQTACPGDPPVFPDPPVDAGIECSDDEGPMCPMGQVCLSGRCFTACTPTSCGPLEMCGPSGACVPRPPVDAGPPDASTPPDAFLLCDLLCEGFEPICRFNACVQCERAPDCMEAPLDIPVCDLGGGVCVEQARALCAPCDADENCAMGATCVTRSVGSQAYERVCLTPCGPMGCTAGFTCSSGQCVPSGTATCTAYRAAATMVPTECADATDCSPYGSTILGVSENARCNGGACQIACMTPTDCPAALGLTACTGGVCRR